MLSKMKKTVGQNAIKPLFILLPTIACALASPQSAYADERQNHLPALPAPDEKATAPASAAGTSPPSAVAQQQQPTAVVVVQTLPPPPPGYEYALKPSARKPPLPHKVEWGVNLHLGNFHMFESSSIGYHDANMFFGGMGFRFRPAPFYALEADLDFASGHDYYDLRRNEKGISLNNVFFLNPRSPVQLYLLVGLVLTRASFSDYKDVNFDYFGLQQGIGLEFRLSKNIALNADLRAIIRGCIGGGETDNADEQTLTVVTARGGATFYW
jgi:hypothetical protein